jgi:GTPase involved in cell partitioning and DNA repair
MDNKERAVRLMSHYFETVWKKAGIRWDADNFVEMETLVEFLIDAAKDETRERVKELESRVKELEEYKDELEEYKDELDSEKALEFSTALYLPTK